MVIRRWERGEGDDSPTPGRSQPRPRIPLFAPGTLAPGEIGRDKQGNIWLGYGDQEVCLYPPEPASAAPAATTVVVQPTATDLPVQGFWPGDLVVIACAGMWRSTQAQTLTAIKAYLKVAPTVAPVVLECSVNATSLGTITITTGSTSGILAANQALVEGDLVWLRITQSGGSGLLMVWE